MPPETPTSTYPIPLLFRRSALGASSVNLEFPPSMRMSPEETRLASSSMVASVTSAGTITQIARGASSRSTRSARLGTSDTSGLWSNPTTSCPASRKRLAMLPPMRPSPTIPSCMTPPVRRGIGSATDPHRHDQVTVTGNGLPVLGSRADDRGLHRGGERDEYVGRVQHREPVEQVAGVERDRERLALEVALHRLAGPGVLAPA